MTIGERIKTLRKAKGLSQIDLAHQAEIAVNSIRLYESGKREPKLEAVEKLSTALGVTKGQLLGWSREPDTMDEEVLALYPGYDPTKETIPEYLARKEKDPEPSQPAKPEVSEEDIKSVNICGFFRRNLCCNQNCHQPASFPFFLTGMIPAFLFMPRSKRVTLFLSCCWRRSV